MERIFGDKCLVGFGSVLVTLFFEVEIAEIHVDHVRVLGIAALIEKRGNRLGPVHVGEADAQDPEGVLDEFAVRPAQFGEPLLTLIDFQARELAIE